MSQKIDKMRVIFCFILAIFLSHNLLNGEIHENVIEKDLYAVLGVKSTASVKEIKKAYRKLAQIYHPDKQITKKNSKLYVREGSMLLFTYETFLDLLH